MTNEPLSAYVLIPPTDNDVSWDELTAAFSGAGKRFACQLENAGVAEGATAGLPGDPAHDDRIRQVSAPGGVMAALTLSGRICLLWLTGACSWFAAAAPADADSVATAIGAELDALMSPDVTTIHGAPIALGDRLRDFYSRREFRAAWTTAQSQGQLLKALADTYDDGLNPADYHLPLLQELSTQVAAPDATDALKAQYDILLTEAGLRAAYHLAFGKVDPESFDAQWNYGRTLPDTDVTQAIENAIASDTVYDRLAALKPTLPLYALLKRELARYRAIEKEGGWSPLPTGSALKPGASDERVPALRARMVRSGDLLDASASDSLLYDAPLAAAVKQYQQRLGLEPDGVVGAANHCGIERTCRGADHSTARQSGSGPGAVARSARAVRGREHRRLHDLSRHRPAGRMERARAGGQDVSAHTALSLGHLVPRLQSDVDRPAGNHCSGYPAGCSTGPAGDHAQGTAGIRRRWARVESGSDRLVAIPQRQHSLHVAPGSRSVECAWPDQVHVSQPVSGVPARYAFAILVRAQPTEPSVPGVYAWNAHWNWRGSC